MWFFLKSKQVFKPSRIHCVFDFGPEVWERVYGPKVAQPGPRIIRIRVQSIVFLRKHGFKTRGEFMDSGDFEDEAR